MCYKYPDGPLAQLVEHLFCKEGVAGSNPVRSTSFKIWLEICGPDTSRVRAILIAQVTCTAAVHDLVHVLLKFKEFVFHIVERFICFTEGSVQHPYKALPLLKGEERDQSSVWNVHTRLLGRLTGCAALGMIYRGGEECTA